jgi:hypothetical protein
MSGESTPRATASAAAFERAFGASATCSRCEVRVEDYRVVATFLHDTVAVRAYCQGCYAAAVEGEYHALGDGMVTDYAGFAERFGAAGPPPPPCTPVDRLLARLIREPALRSLAPPSEALARRARVLPYRFRVEFELGGGARPADLALTREGGVAMLSGDPAACERLKALLA